MLQSRKTMIFRPGGGRWARWPSRAVVTLLLFGAAILPLTGQSAETIRIDRIVASVNDEIITFSDIDKHIQIFPAFRTTAESEQQFYHRILDELINAKIVYLEFRDDFIINEDDFTEVQTQVIKNVGSFQNLQRLLALFNMNWADFKMFIREKIIFDKVITRNFQIKITIQFSEIEAFYNEHYIPVQKSLELKPKTLIEMAPLIETHLRRQGAGEQLTAWLKELAASYRVEKLM